MSGPRWQAEKKRHGLKQLAEPKNANVVKNVLNVTILLVAIMPSCRSKSKQRKLGKTLYQTKHDLLSDYLQLEIVLRLGDQKGFQVLPKRWIIERTNTWGTRNQRLARDYKRLAETAEAFICVLIIRIRQRRLAHN